MRITDIETSIRLHLKYGWNDITRSMPIRWTGRIDKLSQYEIEMGLLENPQARVYSITDFMKMDHVNSEWHEYSGDYCVRIWAGHNASRIFMHFSYPAYTVLPDGEEGTFIEYNFGEQ